MRQTDSTKNNSVIKALITILTAVLFFAFIYDLSTESIKDASYIFLIVCTVLVLVLFRNRTSYTGTFFAMLSGMILKLTYVIYTPVWCRQHDVVDFGAGEGHAAYIEYILEHRALPDFDPRSIWAFFQPPLHHVISAVWMWFNIRMKLPEARIYKNVQIIPLLYMCVLMYIVYLICKELGMKKGGTFITMLIVSFHPIYILMSGSINNDALSVMLSVAAIYAAIIWYMYRVQVGAYRYRVNAERKEAQLKEKGFDCFIWQGDGWYRVQAGAFLLFENAKALCAKLNAQGFETYILYD